MIYLFASGWQNHDLNPGSSACFLLICIQDLSASHINNALQLQRAFDFLNVIVEKLYGRVRRRHSFWIGSSDWLGGWVGGGQESCPWDVFPRTIPLGTLPLPVLELVYHGGWVFQGVLHSWTPCSISFTQLETPMRSAQSLGPWTRYAFSVSSGNFQSSGRDGAVHRQLLWGGDYRNPPTYAQGHWAAWPTGEHRLQPVALQMSRLARVVPADE